MVNPKLDARRMRRRPGPRLSDQENNRKLWVQPRQSNGYESTDSDLRREVAAARAWRQ